MLRWLTVLRRKTLFLCQTGSEWPIKAKIWIVCTPATAFLWFHSNSVRKKKMDLLLLETKKLVWSFISWLIVLWSVSEGVEWKTFRKDHTVLKYFRITALLFLSLSLSTWRSAQGVGASGPPAERPSGPHHEAALPRGGRPPAAHHVDQRQPQHPQRLDPVQGSTARPAH